MERYTFEIHQQRSVETAMGDAKLPRRCGLYNINIRRPVDWALGKPSMFVARGKNPMKEAERKWDRGKEGQTGRGKCQRKPT